jgi:2OG-Fe(II) oxygenase superfamily
MIFKTYSQFSPHARDLRKHFDQSFADPHHSHPNRFAWDYWHIPNEYTFVRTPAFHYFPKKLYDKFHRHLVNWGRENLGCHDVSPTWLSYYVDGCRQHWHRDEPHGPFAFVLSLTRQQRFRGGRTIIQNGRKSITIEPKFNRLTVFDPSLKHGVDEVKGVRDPRQARLVLHGWFVNPRVFWQGRLTAGQVQRVIDEQLQDMFLEQTNLKGYCGWRLSVDRAGRVKNAQLLAETLQGTDTKNQIKRLKNTLQTLYFPSGRSSLLTLPLMFN